MTIPRSTKRLFLNIFIMVLACISLKANSTITSFRLINLGNRVKITLDLDAKTGVKYKPTPTGILLFLPGATFTKPNLFNKTNTSFVKDIAGRVTDEGVEIELGGNCKFNVSPPHLFNNKALGTFSVSFYLEREGEIAAPRINLIFPKKVKNDTQLRLLSDYNAALKSLLKDQGFDADIKLASNIQLTEHMPPGITIRFQDTSFITVRGRYSGQDHVDHTPGDLIVHDINQRVYMRNIKKFILQLKEELTLLPEFQNIKLGANPPRSAYAPLLEINLPTKGAPPQFYSDHKKQLLFLMSLVKAYKEFMADLPTS